MALKYKLQQYIRYKLRAKNEYSLHSPFMFELYNEVFKKAKKSDAAFDLIEKKRRELLKEHSIIQFTDLGAGSKKATSSARKISTIAKNTSKAKKYGRFLAALANYLKSSSILELGTSVGISTMYMAEKNKKATITTIEGDTTIKKVAADNFNELGYKNIYSIEGNFDYTLPILLTKNSYDFIFIDGNHTYEATLRYFELFKNVAKSNTVIVFDDIYWNLDMTKAWKKIISDKKVTATIDMFEFGIVFFNRDLAKQDFVLRY